MKYHIKIVILTVTLIFSQFSIAGTGLRKPITSQLSRAVSKKLTPRLKDQFARRGFEWGAPAYIRVFKHTKELELWVHRDGKYSLFKKYSICYFSGQVGPKRRQGDGQVPEGFYGFSGREMNPYSSYHLSFNIGYPNQLDRYHKRTGGNIMVHGDCVSIGCLAMTNKKIEEIYTIVEASISRGQQVVPVHIFPFRMTMLNRLRFIRFKWQDSWGQMKPAYDYFEKYRVMPKISVEKGRYIIEANESLSSSH